LDPLLDVLIPELLDDLQSDTFLLLTLKLYIYR
jgi:hypothetical protein